jgi:hypothetical protein
MQQLTLSATSAIAKSVSSVRMSVRPSTVEGRERAEPDG